MSLAPAHRRARNLRTSYLGVSVLALTLFAANAPASANSSVHGLWPETSAPSAATVRARQMIELGVTFTSSTAGKVGGVAFFRNTRQTGRHVGSLYDQEGRLLAQATFADTSRRGWREVTFPRPVQIRAGQQYFAAYTAPDGTFARTNNFFTKAHKNGPLTAPIGAGVYRFGAQGSAQPAPQAANYWVDVRFRPDTAQAPNQPVKPATRDKYAWPFASNSIWNMPIGSGADYKSLNLTPPTTAYGTDEIYLAFDPDAPTRRLIDRGYWWPWNPATGLMGRALGTSVKVPDSWIVPPPVPGDYPNRSSAALENDGFAREFQYTVRPSHGSDISVFEGVRARYALDGSGIPGSGEFGAHGGSGMTAIGGTIRVGELTGTEPIRHALALTMNMRKWGTSNGGKVKNGYRWPAIAADHYHSNSNGYGSLARGEASGKDGLGMGSLLAIPATVNLSRLGLETEAGRKLAWTHQNYGAYVVDDSFDPGNWDVHRLNVEIGVLKEFPAIDTYPANNSPFARDMDRIFTRLAVVDNNTPQSIGGGGTPLQPLAPPIG